MKLTYLPKSDFLNYESDTINKICLDICDKYSYNSTDSNNFYSLYYTQPYQSFKKEPTHKYGEVFYTTIFSYQIICHMICVEYPKTYYNIKPFKPHIFKKCCLECKKYMDNNDIHTIYSPIFATEILEGNWKEILDIMNNIFINDNIFIFK
jgi:hypothetical protein